MKALSRDLARYLDTADFFEVIEALNEHEIPVLFWDGREHPDASTVSMILRKTKSSDVIYHWISYERHIIAIDSPQRFQDVFEWLSISEAQGND